MKIASILSIFSIVGQFVTPLVAAADQVATATGNQKLEAVTGTLVEIHDTIAEVKTDVQAVLPQVAAIVGKFADMKHALEALAAPVAAAPAPAGQAAVDHGATT